MFYKRKILKWIKEVHSSWRAGEISDVDYMLMVDVIIGSKKYTQYSFDFAMGVHKENHRRMKEYKKEEVPKNCT